MQQLLSFGVAVLLLGGGQLADPNRAGVSMGHLHYHVRDVEANRKFWVALGGTATRAGSSDAVRFPGVLVVLTEWAPEGTGRSRTIATISHTIYEFLTQGPPDE